MQYTSNYNLLLPEGTDTVNLLTQMNPNTSDIDAAMFANKQAVVGRATELTAGTVHAITRGNADSPVFAFTATSNWVAGDSMSVDGVACSVYLPDGTAPADGAYVINSEVLAIIQGSRVTLFTPGAVPTIDAEDVPYDNTVSGLTATDVQAAIDELASGSDAQLIHTAAANQTFAAQLAELNTAYATLTAEQKARAYIIYGGALKYQVAHVSNGIFTCTYPSGSSVIINSATLSTNKMEYCTMSAPSTITYADISANTNSAAAELYA